MNYRDGRGRPLIIIKNGRMACSRYVDLSLEEKEEYAKVYVLLSNKDTGDLWKFLNFEEENEFCS